MNFTIESANKIIHCYTYLIGKELTEGLDIDYICIVPENNKQAAAFMSYLNQSSNPQGSLVLSGFDKNKVRIKLISHDKFRGDLYHYDIDKYLTKNHIEKCYDSNGVFIET